MLLWKSNHDICEPPEFPGWTSNPSSRVKWPCHRMYVPLAKTHTHHSTWSERANIRVSFSRSVHTAFFFNLLRIAESLQLTAGVMACYSMFGLDFCFVAPLLPWTCIYVQPLTVPYITDTFAGFSVYFDFLFSCFHLLSMSRCWQTQPRWRKMIPSLPGFASVRFLHTLCLPDELRNPGCLL